MWKRDSSGSVRRLVRDGVDTPLASLFTMWQEQWRLTRRARPARAVPRRRSFRRLETLAETKGRFGVNVALPIPFDSAGSLEVDLLCADARVAVELDGAQHLADPVALPAATEERTSSCKRTVIWCSGFSRRASVKSSTRSSTRSCECSVSAHHRRQEAPCISSEEAAVVESARLMRKGCDRRGPSELLCC